MSIVPLTAQAPARRVRPSVSAMDPEQAEMVNTIRGLRNYIPESIGALKGDHKAIDAKLDRLLAATEDIQRRLDRLESTE